tara:strand:- start:2373 stop:2714 length:342 start_codon:yes stop_codon:yes gene_type:complete
VPVDDEKDLSKALEKDIEKGTAAGSVSSTEPEDDNDTDPNLVDFDGPDDPENPLNWKSSKKWGMVTLISAITFLTPLASSMFAPSVRRVRVSCGWAGSVYKLPTLSDHIERQC